MTTLRSEEVELEDRLTTDKTEMQQKLFDCMLKQSDFSLKSGDENAVRKPDLKVQPNFISEFSINQTLR